MTPAAGVLPSQPKKTKPSTETVDAKPAVLSTLSCITVVGANTHNLKQLSCQLPHKALTVVTGPSGSGKSSLAFHTLYAEAQRQFLESLSAYARQFFERIDPPPVEKLEGLLPAVALEQKNPIRHARATVATTVDAYDALRLLLSHGGTQHCKACGSPSVQRVEAKTILTALAQELPKGSRLLVIAPVLKETVSPEKLIAKGFFRVVGEDGVTLHTLENGKPWPKPFNLKACKTVNVLIDRLGLAPEDEEKQARLLEALQQAAALSEGHVIVAPYRKNADETEAFTPKRFTLGHSCLACGTVQEPVTPHWFSFNHPLHACPTCEGYGRVIGLDPDRIIPNKQLSLAEGAVHPFQLPSNAELQEELIEAAELAGIDVETPYALLNETARALIWQGSSVDTGKRGKNDYPGIRGFFDWLESKRYKVHVRVMLARYRGYSECPDCLGTRVKPAALRVTLRQTQKDKEGEETLKTLLEKPIERLLPTLKNLSLSSATQKALNPVLEELLPKLESLLDVGLGYLTLGRTMRSLSGGEAQRVLLSKALGCGMTETLYVLDEPTVGLHPKDTLQLIAKLKRLTQQGNTVVVVEHDPEVMQAADCILDLGPKSGPEGGELIYSGTWEGLLACTASSTGQALQAKTYQPAQATPTETSKVECLHQAYHLSWETIKVSGAVGHNLKNITVSFPTEAWTTLTGVSGAGKTSLLLYTLYAAHCMSQGQLPPFEALPCQAVDGLDNFSEVVLIDQSLPGRSSRSNPITYVKAYDEIRALFASAPKAMALGLTPGDFSFNTPGGRCERCEGLGTITIDMQFMADVTLTCPDCDGKRFGPAVLSVEWFDHSLNDVLNLSVEQAIAFFKTAPKIRKKLEPLQQLGLGYLRLGQATDTLSGGEAQRLKLASYLQGNLLKRQSQRLPTLFLFEEPTKGLHLKDVHQLANVFKTLVAAGHTLIVIEHNPDFIALSDWVIDLGPNGGEGGGQVVACGTPQQVALSGQGHTSGFLRPFF